MPAEAGVNFIDTADAYSDGDVRGDHRPRHRRRIGYDWVLATKVANPVGGMAAPTAPACRGNG